MQSGKKGSVVMAVIVTAVIVGGGMYLWQQSQMREPAKEIVNEESEMPAVVDKPLVRSIKPLSYSTGDLPATVSESATEFGYTLDDLKNKEMECGVTHEDGYLENLISKFQGTSKIVYTFKYNGASQSPDSLILTVLPNKPGYDSIDQFRRDFDICGAGGDAYPYKLNAQWLLFISSCGSGYDDGSGRSVGCDEIKKVIEPTLKLN